MLISYVIHCLQQIIYTTVPVFLIELYLKCLPESRPRKGFDTGNEPNLIEHPKNSFTELISHVILDSRRRKQGVIDGQQEREEGVPGFPLHCLTLLGQLLHSPEPIFNLK